MPKAGQRKDAIGGIIPHTLFCYPRLNEKRKENLWCMGRTSFSLLFRLLQAASPMLVGMESAIAKAGYSESKVLTEPISATGSAQSRKLISNKSYRGEESHRKKVQFPLGERKEQLKQRGWH